LIFSLANRAALRTPSSSAEGLKKLKENEPVPSTPLYQYQGNPRWRDNAWKISFQLVIP
jgi:hypothetical protein